VRLRLMAIALVIVAIAGCGGYEPTRKNEAAYLARLPIEIPGTFTGVVPCADCEGIRLTLNLRADRIFLLRQTYPGVQDGGDASFVDLGRWSVAEDGETLGLKGGTGSPRQFAIRDATTLRMLDSLGGEIVSELNYDLARAERLDPFEDTFRMNGMFFYMADMGLLTECATGKRFPVAQEADNAAMERAYLEARTDPTQSLLVTFEGRLASRPPMEGNGEEEVVIVERFEKIHPGRACERRTARAELLETEWRLVEMGGKPVRRGQGQPTLLLTTAESRASGFAGCNRMMGGYVLDGDGLSFSQTASTRMACAEGMDLEQAYLAAIDATTAHTLAGQVLELYAEDRLLARFEPGPAE